MLLLGGYFYFSGPIWEYLMPPPGGRVVRSTSATAAAYAGPPIRISAVDLVQFYKNNEVDADQRFKGRTLLVSGVVDAIGKDILSAPYVTIRSSDLFRRVQATFAKSDE